MATTSSDFTITMHEATFILTPMTAPQPVTWPVTVTAGTVTYAWVENTSTPSRPWIETEQVIQESVSDPREREDFQAIALRALCELVTLYPRSREALLWAMREGLIDGTTYGTMYNPQKDTHENWLSSPCCIIGWVMRATNIRNSISASLDVAGRNELEAFVRDVRKGETHITNKWLGLLYRQLEELQV